MVRSPKRICHTTPRAHLHEFFKVFIPQRSTHQLLIPPAFQKLLDRNVPQKSTITNLANQTWIVNLVREGNYVYFKEGWQEFVKHHALELGDFLVFQYDGYSSFTVNLFGKNGCAKETNVAANCKEQLLLKQKQEEEPGLEVGRNATGDACGKIEGADNDCLGFEFVEKCKRGRPRKEDRQTFMKAGLERGRKAVRVQQTVYTTKAERPLKHDRQSIDMLKYERDTAPVKKTLCCRTQRRVLASHEKSAAFDAASRYLSQHPSFRIVFTPASIRKSTVKVPWKFVKTFIKGRSRVIHLQVLDRLWPVRMARYENFNCQLTTGWSMFARENHLRGGDVCIFELIKHAGNTVLKVSIFRC
ncbi:hypothetical protein Ancab_003731 [Ancistrocladus abbreviatus]